MKTTELHCEAKTSAMVSDLTIINLHISWDYIFSKVIFHKSSEKSGGEREVEDTTEDSRRMNRNVRGGMGYQNDPFLPTVLSP